MRSVATARAAAEAVQSASQGEYLGGSAGSRWSEKAQTRQGAQRKTMLLQRAAPKGIDQ